MIVGRRRISGQEDEANRPLEGSARSGTDVPKPSASARVRDAAGWMLLLQRTDNGLRTILAGGLKKDETIRECAVRERREETGIEVEITGLVGVGTTLDHVIEYIKGGKGHRGPPVGEICLHARPRPHTGLNTAGRTSARGTGAGAGRQGVSRCGSAGTRP